MSGLIKRVFQVLGFGIALTAILSTLYHQQLGTQPNSNTPSNNISSPKKSLKSRSPSSETLTSGPENLHERLEERKLEPVEVVDNDGIWGKQKKDKDESPVVRSLSNHGDDDDNDEVPNSGHVTLSESMMDKIRHQLNEMTEDFHHKPLRTYDRQHLPRNLSLRGKAIFRIVPPTFLPEYRSPCFQLPFSDGDARLACLPNVFLAGFPKSATTDLFKKVVQHPEIVETPKEPHWWTRTTFSRASVLHYLNHQEKLVEQITKTGNKQLIALDASASTLWDNRYSLGKFSALNEPLNLTHADVLRAVLPDARTIVILRQPSERLYSGYMAFDTNWLAVKSPWDFHLRLLESLRDFSACMDKHTLRVCVNFPLEIRLSVGMYSIFIRDWLKRFPRDQLHILRTESWANHPQLEMTRIFDFLKLDTLAPSALKDIIQSTKENKRGDSDRALGGMLAQTRSLLDAFYQPFNEDLAKLLGDEQYLWSEETTTDELYTVTS